MRQGVALDGVDPIAELMRQIAQAVALERAYAALIEAEDVDLLTWGVQGARPHPYVELLHAQQDRVVNFVVQAGKLGIERRMVAMAEEQHASVVDATIRAIGSPAVGMTIEQQQACRRALAQELRRLDEHPAELLTAGGPAGPSGPAVTLRRPRV